MYTLVFEVLFAVRIGVDSAEGLVVPGPITMPPVAAPRPAPTAIVNVVLVGTVWIVYDPLYPETEKFCSTTCSPTANSCATPVVMVAVFPELEAVAAV